MRKSIRVHERNGERTIDLRGPWSKKEIRQIASQYSDAEIYLNGQRIQTLKIEEEREPSPEKMALDRFKEKKEEKDR